MRVGGSLIMVDLTFNDGVEEEREMEWEREREMMMMDVDG